VNSISRTQPSPPRLRPSPPAASSVRSRYSAYNCDDGRIDALSRDRPVPSFRHLQSQSVQSVQQPEGFVLTFVMCTCTQLWPFQSGPAPAPPLFVSDVWEVLLTLWSHNSQSPRPACHQYHADRSQRSSCVVSSVQLMRLTCCSPPVTLHKLERLLKSRPSPSAKPRYCRRRRPLLQSELASIREGRPA
jgi:hypothetical protein